MGSKKKKNDSKPAAAPKPPKPTANGKPEELCYTSAQYPVKELYQALLSRISALTNAGYECLWHPIDLSGEKELLVPHHVSRVDDRTLKAWPLIVSEKKTGGVPALQLGMEIDMLENVAVLKGIGRIPRDENRYETVHAILSQFKAVTGIELTVEARG